MPVMLYRPRYTIASPKGTMKIRFHQLSSHAAVITNLDGEGRPYDEMVSGPRGATSIIGIHLYIAVKLACATRVTEVAATAEGGNPSNSASARNPFATARPARSFATRAARSVGLAIVHDRGGTSGFRRGGTRSRGLRAATQLPRRESIPLLLARAVAERPSR